MSRSATLLFPHCLLHSCLDERMRLHHFVDLIERKIVPAPEVHDPASQGTNFRIPHRSIPIKQTDAYLVESETRL